MSVWGVRRTDCEGGKDRSAPRDVESEVRIILEVGDEVGVEIAVSDSHKSNSPLSQILVFLQRSQLPFQSPIVLTSSLKLRRDCSSCPTTPLRSIPGHGTVICFVVLCVAL